ncbi:MAG TPA: LuxR C-terminal-related transcriptional regulator [Chloroflexota bacterium]|nr:LuxR C-terminal-related transcriptional regulator [Chloroflexota bacterium]
MVELLSTKLFIPRPRKSLVSRPRLVDHLNTGVDKKLTLIAAPPGFGKTTLLSEWIPQSPRCVTWLSLDDGDNDPLKFWAYFIKSLQALRPELGESAFSLLQSPQLIPITSVLTALINEITAFPDGFAIVLDDYHVIDSQPIHEALKFLLEHQPANMHLVITTRIDPSLPLSRLRARDQLTELRANDLRFTVDETAIFLHQVMGLNLSGEEVAALEARTEGWIAGLQIAALSMQGQDDISGFIRGFSGSHRHILGYLADEVINQQPAEKLKFLLQTSILDRLCGSLCDAVTGDVSGQTILEELEHANLFITPLDDAGVWYRYHHLFVDVLQKRLSLTAPKEGVDVAELHGRATTWFEQQGLIDEAIRHALAAPDVERAAILVEQYSMAMLQESKIFLIRLWLEQLPREMIHTRPRLLLAYGWILILTGHVTALDEWLARPQAKTALAAPDLPAEIVGELTLLQATLARFRREHEQSLQLALAAFNLLRDDKRGLQAGAMYTIGVAHLQRGDVASASRAFTEAVRLGEAKGGPYMALGALDTLSDIQIRQGHLAQARQLCQQALQMAERQGWQAMPAMGMIYIHLGRALYEYNDLEGAYAALTNAVDRLRGSIEQFLLAQGYLLLAQVHLARGDRDGALTTVQQGEQWFTQMQVADTGAGTLLKIGKVRLWIASGDLNAATHWAYECHWLPENTPLGYLQATLLVRLRLAQSPYENQAHFLDEVAAMLDRQVVIMEAGQWRGQLIELLILRSLLLQAQSDATAMLISLEQALILAEPEGYVRTFLDEGEPVRLLLLEYQSRVKKRISDGVASESLRLLTYTDRLLAAFSQPIPSEKPGGKPLPEPLSERELDILRLITTGRSNQEIAEILVIAVSTVKSHINNLYSKLGTNRRTEAIAIARDLGLLSD